MFCIIIRKLPYVYAKTSAFHVSIFRVKSLHFNNWWLGVLGRLGGLGRLGVLGGWEFWESWEFWEFWEDWELWEDWEAWVFCLKS